MRKMLGRVLVGVAALALLAAGAGPARAQQTLYVEISDCDEFDPGELTIGQGDTVVWVWVSGTHSTTSDDCPCCGCSWDSGVHDTGCPPYQFQYTFNDVGDYLYHCTVHKLKAEIHVVPAPAQVAARLAADRPAGVALLAVGLCGCGLCGYARHRRKPVA
jgi:plastocyanin